MRKILIVTLLICLFSTVIRAENTGGLENENPTRYEISVMTCSPSEELYASFGHTAIRVKDNLSGDDTVFNFGTFDFSTPNFYLKFLRGDLDYMLSTENFRSFVDGYTFSARSIIEQKIDLPEELVEQIVSELHRLYLPENRAYRYKFIQKNCTTAVRDLIVPYVASEEGSPLSEPTGKSYRDYLAAYLYDKPWIRVGINFMMGSTVDRNANLQQSMFLPDQLMYGLDKISYEGTPVVSETVRANNENIPEYHSSFFMRFYPALVVLALCILVIALRKWSVDAVFLTVVGLLGILLCFLMFFSGHTEFKNNLNLLWCSPVLLVSAIAIVFKWPKTLVITSAMQSLFVLVMLVVWITGGQGFEWSFLFVAGTTVWILLRCMRTELKLIKPTDVKLNRQQ